MIKDANCFLVVSTKDGAFGKGMSIEQATTNLKCETGKREKIDATVIAFSCTVDQVTVEASVNLSYFFPKDAVAVRFKTRL